MTEEVLRTTMSICPECMVQIPAEFYVDPKNNYVMLRKTCEEHGEFKDKISIDADEYKWQMNFTDEIGSTVNITTKPCDVSSGIKDTKLGCPNDCGLCENHKSAPCICLIDVTNRCNLTCPICFANASAAGYVVEPTYDEIVQIMEHFRSMKPFPAVLLQFAGGEPTLRKDLPEIIRKGKELGFTETMLSTNGVRIAKSVDYLQSLKDAGLDTIYLQFDATNDPEVWKKVRGVNLWPIKKKVIEHCEQIGGITIMLVPVIAKGVNDHQVGPIMEFAKEHTKVIGGVVFQPISLCGRISFEELMDLRYTTSDLKVDLQKATGGALTKFYPLATTAKFTKLLAWFDNQPPWAAVSHHDCGFANILVINDKNEWEPLENYVDAESVVRWANKCWDMVQDKEIPKPTSLLKGINLADYGGLASTLGKFIDDMTSLGYRNMMKAYFFAGMVKYLKFSKVMSGKTIQSIIRLVATPNLNSAGNFFLSKNMLVSAMHFQDAYNFDLNRVSQCLVHYGVVDPDDHSKTLEMPFCSYNTLHRPRIEKALAIKDQETEKPEVIQSKIESYIDSMDK